MEKKQPDIKILVDIREGKQNPSAVNIRSLPERIMDPNLKPPPQENPAAVLQLIRELSWNPTYILELPNSMSSPTIARRNAQYLTEAKLCGVDSQMAVHTRIKEMDFRLAVACGAKRIHLFGNSSETAEANGHSRPIKEIVGELFKIAGLAGKLGVESLRGSLEQATETDTTKIVEFIQGVKDINSYFFQIYGRNIITDLGLPDTNGVAQPNDYIEMLTTVAPILKDSGLRLSIHLHDDSGNAYKNAQVVMKFALDNDIPIMLEVSNPKFPGERVGIRPTYDDVHNLGLPIVPQSAYNVLEGDTWVESNEDLSDPTKRQYAKLFHVAGIHTLVLDNYSNGHEAYPHPGIYTIMGQGNLLYLMNELGIDSPDKILIKKSALVARELAAQFGNLDQKYAVAYVKFIVNNKDYMYDLESKFGTPDTWLANPSVPDLNYVKEQLDMMVKDVMIPEAAY